MLSNSDFRTRKFFTSANTLDKLTLCAPLSVASQLKGLWLCVEGQIDVRILCIKHLQIHKALNIVQGVQEKRSYFVSYEYLLKVQFFMTPCTWLAPCWNINSKTVKSIQGVNVWWALLKKNYEDFVQWAMIFLCIFYGWLDLDIMKYVAVRPDKHQESCYLGILKLNILIKISNNIDHS